MKLWLKVGVMGMALAVPVAFGIGRSGNGTIVKSERTGFEAPMPENFLSAEALSDSRLRLISPILEPVHSGLLQPFLELSDLDQSLPALAGLERSLLALEMDKLGWKKVVATEACVEAFLQSQENSFALALFWGGKKGLVVIGPKSPSVRMALESFRSELRLAPGACAWK